MQAEVAEILAGRDRFDPDITPKLEAYVEEQVLDRQLRMACRRLLAQARSIFACPPPLLQQALIRARCTCANDGVRFRSPGRGCLCLSFLLMRPNLD